MQTPEDRHVPIPQEGHLARELGVDLARLPSLWDAIYGQQQGYIALLSGLRVDRRLVEPRNAFYRWPHDGRSAARWVRGQAERGRELYHCAHLLGATRRRKEDALPLASLYADVDQGEIRAGVREPTLVVESSPGKLQAYWRLTEPVAPLVGEELNRRLAYALGADPSGWDLTQLLRVPGTRNHKYPDAPLVRVLSLSAARYEPALFAGLPPAPARERTRQPERRVLPRSVMSRAEPPVKLSRPGLAVWSGQDVKYTLEGRVDRSASLLRIARVLYEAGMESQAIVVALVERDRALGWEKYSGRRDAAAQYAAIVAAVARGSRTRRRTQMSGEER